MAAPFQNKESDSSAFVVAKWVIAFCLSVWLKVPVVIQALMILMVIDYVTGIILALMQCNLSSGAGLRGLAKKVLTLLLVLTAHYLVKAMNLSFDFASTVAGTFAANELISITENCAEAGVPIPQPILDVLARAKRISGGNKPQSS